MNSLKLIISNIGMPVRGVQLRVLIFLAISFFSKSLYAHSTIGLTPPGTATAACVGNTISLTSESDEAGADFAIVLVSINGGAFNTTGSASATSGGVLKTYVFNSLSFVLANSSTTFEYRVRFGPTANDAQFGLPGSFETTNTITITINPLPTATLTALGGINSACQNASSPTVNITGVIGTAPFTYTYRITDPLGNVGSIIPIQSNMAGLAQLTVPTNGTTGTYTYELLTIVDGSSTACSNTSMATLTMTINPNPTIAISPFTPTACEGSSSFDVQYLTTNSPDRYSIVWAGSAIAEGFPDVNPTLTNSNLSTVTGTLTINISNTAPAGTYSGTLTVRNNATMCTFSGAAQLIVNPLPDVTVSLTGTNTFCAGGSATLSVPNVAGSNYLWTGGGTNFDRVVTTSGGYSVTVTNTAGCTATSSSTNITVNALPDVTVTLTGTNTFCVGGSATLSVPNVAGSNYLWTGGGTNFDRVVTTSGGYSVTVTNTAGCTATSSSTNITVNALPDVTVTLTGVNTFCAGGSATLSVPNVAGSSYLWTGGGTNFDRVVTTSGGYSVTVTNTAGCTATSSSTNITVNNLPDVTVTLTGVNTFCVGGSATLSVPNVAGSSYLWTGGGTNFDRVVTTAGGYSVTVTNTAGCTATSSSTNITVNNLPDVTVTLTGVNTFCAGGSATLSVPNVAGSSYLWTGGGTNFDRVVTTAGGYSVTVTNTAGCTATSSSTNITVNALPDVTVTLTGTNTFCVGGSATLSVSNVAGSNYLWTGGGTNFDRVVTTSGGYSVTVTNTAGCTATSSSTNITVNALPDVTVTLTGTNTFCAGGSATLSVPNVAGSSYLWTGGGTNFDRVVTTSGGYSVTVTNTAGCTATSSSTNITVNALPDVTVTLTGVNTFCAGGSATLSVPNVAGSNYLWTGGGTNFDRVVTTSGGYSVTVTNTAGCTATSSSTNITVNALPDVTVTLTGTNTFCAGGSATLSVPNVAGSNYLWTGGGTNFDRVVTTSGGYSVTVTNTAGCTATSSSTNITVNALPDVTVTLTGVNTFCAGGSATLSVPNVAGSSYLWTGGGTNFDRVVNTAGGYSVTVTNTAGCTATSSSTNITVNALPTATITPAGATTFCAGGSVTLNANTGAGLTYLWTGGGTSNNRVYNSAGNYSVTVTDGNNCSATSAPVTVTVNALPTAAITAASATTFCAGGSVTLNANTGAGLTYLWTGGGTSNNRIYNSAGNYSVTVTDANNCSATSAPATVTVNPLPTPTIIASGPLTFCAGNSVSLSASGGASYVWNNASTGVSVTNIITSGVYTVTATDANNCSATSAPVTVTVNPLPTVSITHPAPVCSPGTIDITAAAVTAGSTTGLNYTYWSNAVGTQTLTTPFAIGTAGTYYIRGTSTATNCAVIQPVTVNILAQAAMQINTPAAVCAPQTVDLTVPAITNGSATGLTYTYFSNAAATTVLNNPNVVNTSGVYYIKGTPASGCSAVVPVTVTINPLPTLVINQPSAVCSPQVINLTSASVTAGSSAGLSYAYFANSSLTSPLADAQAVNQTGVFYIRATDAVTGCVRAAQVTVQINAAPQGVLQTPAGNIICENSSLTLNASGANSYQWLYNQQPVTGATAAAYEATQAGEYAVRFISAQGCVAVSGNSIQLEILRKPTVQFTLNNACVGVATSFNNTSVTSTSGGINWLWDFGDGSSSNQFSPTHIYSSAGSYSVRLTASSPLCSGFTESTLVTYRVQSAVPAIRYKDVEVLKDIPVTITARAIGNSYQWQPVAGVSNSTSASPSIRVSTTTEYTVAITNDIGCTTTDTVLVKLISGVDIYVPQGFTPNNDGQNDRLYPILVGMRQLNYFRVFNRWGNMIFTTKESSPQSGWNGMYLGVQQPMGSYTWVAEATDLLGNLVRKTGTVLLLK